MPQTLVIVESPTKAKTISKFLGKGFIVESSFGHVRDLPKKKMGVDTEGGTFAPSYIVSPEKKEQVKKLKAAAEKSDKVIFATDEDREGEAISWHLAHLLGIAPKNAERIVFHEITKHAIAEALKRPRAIDEKLVDAQQARRILDRLVGYELSPLLWKKVARGLSAGRVQSVAVRLIVEREREIRNFKTEEYWTIDGLFQNSDAPFAQDLRAALSAIDGAALQKLDIKNKAQADAILSDLKGATYTIKKIEKKEAKRTPPPPFTTSTLQQSANQKLGLSAKQTMRIAQQLYEGVELGGEGSVGLITYMRTDSVNLSQKFLEEAGAFVRNAFGSEYALPSPRVYKTKSKGAQEAHEAIRPADPSRTPESVKAFLEPQQLKLYTLIWNRAVATQMSEARINKTAIDIVSGIYLFRATGQTMLFDGWLRLYPGAAKETMLTELAEGMMLACAQLEPTQHFTEPPARYSDATLVKTLEEYGIGRPSTYAPTIATIEDRGYIVRNEEKRLQPNDIAFIVNDLLVEHFHSVVDYGFTANLEQRLDDIAEGEVAWHPVIKDFYEPFHRTIVEKTAALEKKDVVQARELGVDPASGKPVSVRIGRYGPFVQLGTKDDEEKPTFASLTKDMDIQTVTLPDALKLLSLPRTLGTDADGNDVLVNRGRFGPYVKIKDEYFSIKDKDPYTITLEEALEVVKVEKEKKANKIIKAFGGTSIQILHGRYGPYITDGTKNARMPKDADPASLTREQCEELLKNAKPARRYNTRKGVSRKKTA